MGKQDKSEMKEETSDPSETSSHIEGPVGSCTNVSLSGESKATCEEEGKEFVTKEELAQRETSAVCRLRLAVVFVLFMAATGVCFIVHFITTKSETYLFDAQFNGAASKLLESFQIFADEKMEAIGALGVAYTAHGLDHDSEWPFVTLSAFQQRATSTRKLSNALFVTVAPYVSDAQQIQWENFVAGNDSAWM